MKNVVFIFLLLPLAFFTCNICPASGQSLSDAWAKHAKGDPDSLATSLAMYRQIASDTSRSQGDVKAATYAIGTVLLSQKNYADAVAQFDRFEKAWPWDYRTGLSLCHSGNAMLEQGNYSQAETHFMAALRLQLSAPDTAQYLGWALLGEAKVLMHRKDFPNAVVSLSQAISWAPETCVANEAKALLQQCPGGADALGESSAMSSGMAIAALTAARNYVLSGKYSIAHLLLQKATPKLTNSSDLAESYVLTGECEMALHQSSPVGGAYKAIEGIKDQSPEFLAKRAHWLSLAAEQVMGRDSDDSVSILKRFISQYPNYPSAAGFAIIIGQRLLNANRVQDARDWYNQLLTANPSNENTVLWKFQLAYCLYHEANWTAARSALQEVYDGNPLSQWHDQMKYLVADCSIHLQDYTAARKALGELQKDFPKSTWSSLGAQALVSLPAK